MLLVIKSRCVAAISDRGQKSALGGLSGTDSIRIFYICSSTSCIYISTIIVAFAHLPSRSYFLTLVRNHILILGDLPVSSHKQFLAIGLFKPLPPPDKPSPVFSPDHPASGHRPSHKQLHVFQVFKPPSTPLQAFSSIFPAVGETLPPMITGLIAYL